MNLSLLNNLKENEIKEIIKNLIPHFNNYMEQGLYDNLFYIIKNVSENPIALSLLKKENLSLYKFYTASYEDYNNLNDLFFEMLKFGFFDNKFSYYEEKTKNGIVKCYFCVKSFYYMVTGRTNERENYEKIILDVMARDKTFKVNYLLYLSAAQNMAETHAFESMIKGINLLFEQTILKEKIDAKNNKKELL